MIKDPGHFNGEAAICSFISKIKARLTTINLYEMVTLEGLCFVMASHAESKSKIQNLREDLASILAQERYFHHWGLIFVELMASLTNLYDWLRAKALTLQSGFKQLCC